jgi:hypothetical protein
MNTWSHACESQQQKLNLIMKDNLSKVVSSASLVTDFVKENH